MAESSRQQLLGSFKKCLDSGEYSDLIITCGSDSYKVHKMVVCTRAVVFARAIKFGGKETSEEKINLPDDEPAVVKLLVQYLYEGEYEPRLTSALGAPTNKLPGFVCIKSEVTSQRYDYSYTYDFPHTCRGRCSQFCVCPHHYCSENCDYTCQNFVCDKCTHPAINGPASQSLIHAKMYEIADKYEVVGLKDLAREKFKASCAVFWDDDAFSTAAHYAFCTTMADDKGLRDIVSSTISKHMELIQKAEIQALLSEHNGLSLGIMLKKADEHGWVRK